MESENNITMLSPYRQICSHNARITPGKCPRISDWIYCWPEADANTTIYLPSPDSAREFKHYVNSAGYLRDKTIYKSKYLSRHCFENGTWGETDHTHHNMKTNYEDREISAYVQNCSMVLDLILG